MNTKIIYIAGYGSTHDSNLTTQLRNKYPSKSLLLIHDYDFNNPKNVIKQLDRKINDFCEIKGGIINEDVVIIGQSWGGYFANYFSEKYGIPAFLINPQVKPELSELLKKCADLKGIPNSNDKRRITKIIFLSTNDTIVKNEWVTCVFGSRKIIKLNGEGHSIKNFNTFFNTFDNYINNLQESL